MNEMYYNTHLTLKDFVHIAYHFGLDVRKTVIDFVYDPIAISNYFVMHHYDSIYPSIIAEPASNKILFKRNGVLSELYQYDSQNHKIIPD